MSEPKMPPILSHKHHDASSAFTPESLLREARRQKGLSTGTVPGICVLDPDGDIVRHLRATGRAERHLGWAEVTLMRNRQPEAKSSSAISTANAAPTAQPTIPYSCPS